jgi:hypothetical protein
MTFLKSEDGFAPIPTPMRPGARKGTKQKYHWEVEYDLVMIVDGRNLRYEARWPPRPRDGTQDSSHSWEDVDNQPMEDCGQGNEEHGISSNEAGQRTLIAKRVCIAAAFKPGTL